MAWTRPLTDRLLGHLRFVMRSAFLIGGIAASGLLAYVLVKLCYFTAGYLNRTVFQHPW